MGIFRATKSISRILGLAFGLLVVAQVAIAADTQFRRIPVQFIAALGEPTANAGQGAQTWGLWDVDPGPRGVWLRYYNILKATGGTAPTGWTFDPNDWWLDENGLIMEKPVFPLQPGKYLVTGNRETIAVLTIYESDENGERRWELSDDARLYDVTHLPCRSSRFKPLKSGTLCSPANAIQPAFPIATGTAMPEVQGCQKQDYSVLFVIGVAVDSQS